MKFFIRDGILFFLSRFIFFQTFSAVILIALNFLKLLIFNYLLLCNLMSVHFVHTIDNIMYLVICSFSLIGSVKFINLIILSHVGLIFNWPFHLWWHTFFLLYHATLCLVLTSYYFVTSMDRCVCILVQFTRLGKRQCVLFTCTSTFFFELNMKKMSLFTWDNSYSLLHSKPTAAKLRSIRFLREVPHKWQNNSI